MSLTCQVQNPFPACLARLAKAGLFLLGLVALAVPAARAQMTWTGTTNNAWTTTTNWSGTYTSSNTATATFTGGAVTNRTLTIAGTITLETLTFSSSQAYTISGGTAMAFGTNADGITLSGTGGSLSITTPVTLANTLTITDSAGNTNTVTLAGITGTARNIAITGTGTGAITFSGIIGTTTGTFTMGGAGTVTLSGANTYSGTSTLTSGTVVVGNAKALGTGTISLDGGTIESNAAETLTNASSIAATGSIIGGSSALTMSGLMTNSNASDTLNLNNTGGTTLGAIDLSTSGATAYTLTMATGTGATTTISGIIANGGTGANILTETGTGTLYLTGSNTYSGGMTLTGGTLEVGQNAALGTGTFTWNGGTIEGDGTARTMTNSSTIAATGSTVTGSSALTFSGTMTNDVAAATLNLNNTGGTTFSNATAIDLSNSGTAHTLTLATGPSATTTISGIIANGGGSTSLLAETASSSTGGTLYLTGTNTYTGGTTLTGGTLEVGNNAALGTTGAVSLNGGTIESDNTARTLSVPVSITATGSTITNSGTATALNFSGAVTNYGSFTLNLNNTAGTTFSGSTFALSNSSTDQILTLATGTGATTTISGIISNGSTSTSGLTKSGSGTLILSGTNTYTGDTNVSVGTLTISALNALSSSTDVTVATGATLSGTFSDTIGSLAGTGTASVVLTGGNLSTGNDNASTTFSGVISGSTILTKIGTGVFTLGGTNTYTGITNIDGGTLAISADSGLGTAPGAAVANQLTFDGGTLEITGAGFTLNSKRGITLYSSGGNIDVASGATLTYAGIMTGGNPFTKSDAGTLILSGANTNTGTTTINGGTLSIGADTGLGTAPGSVTANDLNFSNDGTLNASASFTLNSNRGITLNTGGGTIDVSSGATLTYGGIMAGASSNAFTKTDSGTLILSGINTFSGATNINGGTLSIAADSGLGTAPGSVTANDLNFGGGTLNTSASFTLNSNRGVTLNTGGGTFDENSGTTLTYGGIIAGASSSNALTKADTGTLILTGANTFIGAVNVNGGSLVVENNAGLGAGTAGTTVASGATLELDTGVTVDNGLLTISGTGVGGNGALLNGSGANTWNDNITLGASATINSGTSANSLLQLGPATSVDTLALGTNTLTFTGGANTSTLEESTITGTGATGVIVNTSGNVHYYSNDNTYTGTTSIVNGTLIVDTGNSETPRNTNVGIAGSIIVGDGTGAPGSALLQMAELGAATRSDDEAISANLTLTVNSDGQVNLNNQHESIGTLILTGGNVDTQSSGGQNGLYLNNASVVVNANPITAGISGVLNLEPLNSTGAPVNFNVTAGGNVTSDLTIPAELQDGSFIKSGNGTMVLEGNNYQFQGTAEVQAGTLNIQSHNALGTSVGATTVDSGGQLQLSNGTGAGLTFDAEALTISGNGTFGVAQTQSTPGALYNIEGNNTWTGSISTLASATIYNNTNSNLTITGAISPTSGSNTLTLAGPATTTISGAISGGLSLVKNGTGTLVLNGTSNNSFTGSVVINAGSVILSAPTGTNAISGSGITINSGGTLLNAASNQFAPNIPMTLNGGTWNVQGYSEGVSGSLGSGSVGTLTLSATSSLELGTPVGANSIVHFANSTATQGSWSGTLDIIGWTGLSTNPEAGGGPDEVFFGTTGSVGLTMSSGQIADIEFININPGHGYGIGNYDATILSDGEIVPFLPVPEPATTAAGAALVALAGLTEWRRRKARRSAAIVVSVA